MVGRPSHLWSRRVGASRVDVVAQRDKTRLMFELRPGRRTRREVVLPALHLPARVRSLIPSRMLPTEARSKPNNAGAQMTTRMTSCRCSRLCAVGFDLLSSHHIYVSSSAAFRRSCGHASPCGHAKRSDAGSRSGGNPDHVDRGVPRVLLGRQDASSFACRRRVPHLRAAGCQLAHGDER